MPEMASLDHLLGATTLTIDRVLMTSPADVATYASLAD